MRQYSGKELANMLDGAEAIFSDTPPPGPLLNHAREALPAPDFKQSYNIQSVNVNFDMSDFLDKGPGMEGPS